MCIRDSSYDKSIRDLIHGYNPVIVDNDGNIKWETKVTLKGEPAVKNNKDGSKTFTVTLNDGLKWNDGKPVTANDYVMTYLMRASKSWIDANEMCIRDRYLRIFNLKSAILKKSRLWEETDVVKPPY